MATISVDPISSPRIITILSPAVSISIQELVNLLRDWEDEPTNLEYDHLISAAGKEALGGGVQVGVTVILLNAKVAFEARPPSTYVQCEISGGNLVAIDINGDPMSPVEPTAFTQVVRAASSSATIAEGSGGVTAQQVWEYNARTLTSGLGGLATILSYVTDLRDEALGKWDIDLTVTPNQLILYRVDGATELKRFNLTEMPIGGGYKTRTPV
jgi:hypothetical protein